jgi:hypothetical protein
MFSDADFDLLADFVGGALDGTPEADDVRRRVSTDASWAEAYAALVSAEVAVRDELTALGAETLTVPVDVGHRLDTALQAAVVAPRPGAPVLDLARAREARRHRRQRWAVGLATAAAVLICGGFGVSLVSDEAKKDTPTSAADGGKGEAAPQLNSGPSPTGGSRTSAQGTASILASGRDYGPGTVGQVAQGSPPAAQVLPDGEGSRNADVSKSAKPAESVPDPLRRLLDPVARAACLNAVVGEYGGQVALVDYARFEGQPALVVIVDGTRVGAGKRLVLVVGPDCGIGGAIADELYRGTA